ncbi:MAG: hypothetical protein ACUZ8I_10670 [Candidatus Scalindua sp.]
MIKFNRFNFTLLIIFIMLFANFRLAISQDLSISAESDIWNLKVNDVIMAKWGKSDSLGYYQVSGEGREAEYQPKGSSILAMFSVKDEKTSVLIVECDIKNKQKTHNKLNLDSILLTNDLGKVITPILHRLPVDSLYQGPTNKQYYINFPPEKVFRMKIISLISDETKQISFSLPSLSKIEIKPRKP